MELDLPSPDKKNARLQGGRRQWQYFIVDLLFLLQRLFIGVDDGFPECSSCAARDGVKHVSVLLFAVLLIDPLGHDDAQPASGLRKLDAVQLEHPVKGDRRVGFDLRARVSNVVDGDFYVGKIHFHSSYICMVISSRLGCISALF